MTSISAIAIEINKIAPSHEFGRLQKLRKQLKGLKNERSMIFDITKKSVNDKEGWAFHTGGREELQFNIGIEEEEEERFRFGVAFSLKPSRSLPDIGVFLPKIERFNEFIRLNAFDLSSFRMWIWRGDKIIKRDSAVRSITEDEIEKPNFIFLGKSVPIESIDISEIGRIFDDLFPLYRFVEDASDGTYLPDGPVLDLPFTFREGVTLGNTAAARAGTQSCIDVQLRSNQIKRLLCKELGNNTLKIQVGDEIPSGNGGRIDLVTLSPSGHYEFYEIKPAVLARNAIREALPQLLEYAYRRGGVEARRLVIVSQAPLDNDSRDFLVNLRSKGLPIEYQRVALD